MGTIYCRPINGGDCAVLDLGNRTVRFMSLADFEFGRGAVERYYPLHRDQLLTQPTFLVRAGKWIVTADVANKTLLGWDYQNYGIGSFTILMSWSGPASENPPSFEEPYGACSGPADETGDTFWLLDRVSTHCASRALGRVA